MSRDLATASVAELRALLERVKSNPDAEPGWQGSIEAMIRERVAGARALANWRPGRWNYTLELTPALELRVEARSFPEPPELPAWAVVCEPLGLDEDIQQPGDVKKQALELLVVHLQGLMHQVQQLLGEKA